jgi:hypothetical protein
MVWWNMAQQHVHCVAVRKPSLFQKGVSLYKGWKDDASLLRRAGAVHLESFPSMLTKYHSK